MKKTWSKLLALAMALVMCLSLLPAAALAEETNGPTGVGVTLVGVTNRAATPPMMSVGQLIFDSSLRASKRNIAFAFFRKRSYDDDLVNRASRGNNLRFFCKYLSEYILSAVSTIRAV